VRRPRCQEQRSDTEYRHLADAGGKPFRGSLQHLILLRVKKLFMSFFVAHVAAEFTLVEVV
jgi:hypothetical protein